MIFEAPPRWTGRDDADDPRAGARWHHIVHAAHEQPAHEQPAQAGALALLGFATDEGVRRNRGRPGAAEGPDALRRALANLPHLPPLRVVDHGTLRCDDGALEAAHEAHARWVIRTLEAGAFPLTLGGGHEIAWSTWLGVHAALPPRASVLVVNLDAHFDLREAPHATSGTPFLQMHRHARTHARTLRCHASGISEWANTHGLFDRARELGQSFTLDEALQSADEVRLECERLRALVDAHDAVYLTLCLDVLPAAEAPGVSAPSALGVPLAHVEQLVSALAASPRLVAADVAELNPSLDIDHRTARAAARLVGRLARGIATRSAPTRSGDSP